ncbi:dTDP-4-dehydrorhamnose 3,5-epimerase [Tenacibaculum sp. MAR_2009_124]|uniref:dTDP-4-dehydrorhamnose 3,5-epimerase n=1 Tax=Tenacibaculum sp. MAR_2009_124 TaxID=1250059 RepID=UPI0008997C3F|nr:dTDP-4-dehydrorhamnose 3,5-epimerase [Tenacibaculum sp. MAR_2009_124]SEB42483.1 dTDP-4-dehydrorhamnose 3,5-epimerase [Tenacibaculum sp. MAR_2009_124]
MNFIATKIPNLTIIEPKVFGDERGYFFESFNAKQFEEYVHKINFVQDNESKSSKGVLRGLHFQKPPYAQAKLVRCIQGKVLDVAVDIRKGSPTFGDYVSVELSEENKKQLFIPRGFAHGFVVLSEEAIFSYKVDNRYAPEYDSGIIWNDQILNIDWGIESEKFVLSDKDKELDMFKNLESPFTY